MIYANNKPIKVTRRWRGHVWQMPGKVETALPALTMWAWCGK